MRVKFLKDWQGESSASFKKDEIADLDDLDLVWELAMQGVVRMKATPDPDKPKQKKKINSKNR